MELLFAVSLLGPVFLFVAVTVVSLWWEHRKLGKGRFPVK